MATPVWAIPLLCANRRLNRLTRELNRLARSDPLSGLPNRRAFFERGDAILADADAAGLPSAVMMIDLDRFKAVNDQFGHDVGDTVLCAVAGTIRGAVADDANALRAVLARIGGEEFAIVAGGVDLETATRFAGRICERVRCLVCAPNGKLVAPTVSIGVAMRGPGENLDLVLRAADRAAYAAKRRGGDRWCLARGTARSKHRNRHRVRTRSTSPRRCKMDRDLRPRAAQHVPHLRRGVG